MTVYIRYRPHRWTWMYSVTDAYGWVYCRWRLQRNGKSGKTILADDGPLHLEIPKDRDGSFAPILIPKHERGLHALMTTPCHVRPWHDGT